MSLRALGVLIGSLALAGALVACDSTAGSSSPATPIPLTPPPSPTATTASAAPTTPTSAATPTVAVTTAVSTPTAVVSPTTNGAETPIFAQPTPAVATAIPTPAASPIAGQPQITAADSGKTFTYPLTSRFQIILNGQTYPRSNLKITCDGPQVIGSISNLPSVSPPDYVVRYEGVNPGLCAFADGTFQITVQITASPDAGVTPAATAGGTSAAGTPSPVAEAAPPGTHVGGSPVYVDDRSSGADVIRSYYNAIDRHEYDRAYSYWEPGTSSQQLPPYDQFKQGYADTQSVQLVIGPEWGQGAAGNFYQSVAVGLTSTLKSGATQSYVGCYVLHLGNPTIQDNPPFRPWAIQSAMVQSLASGANPADQFSTICNQNGAAPGGPVPTPPANNPNDISKDRYLDDRSTPEEVLHSLFNAVNSHEYDRAYSYWESGAQLPTYDQFKQGYADTTSVALTLGQTKVGVGAGQIYYSVPTTLVAQTTSGATQTFVGCYTLHLSEPAIQDQPPFHPMAIQSADVHQVPNDANTADLMGQACH